MKVIHYLIMTSLFLLLFTLPAPATYACDCMISDSPTEEMARKDAVFSGKVLKIVDRNKHGFIKSSADPMQVIIAVDEIWKGIKESQVVVFTERDSASCGFEFQVGQEYIVYASEEGDHLKVSYCSRTALLSLASDDISELGKGETPSIELVMDTDEKEKPNRYSWIYVTGGILLLIAAAVFISRKTKL